MQTAQTCDEANLPEAPPLDGTLGSFVWPLSEAEFLANYFDKKPLMVSARAERIDPILEAIKGRDVEEILAARKAPVDVWYKTTDGDTRRISVPPVHGLNLYRQGMTVFIPRVEELFPFLRTLGAGVGYDTPRDAPSTASLVANRAGSVTSWHWDALQNFTVHLRGRKQWRIAATPIVRNPLVNWMMPEVPIEPLAPCLHRELPRDEPESSIHKFDLQPGCTIYTPRGLIHTTTAVTDSLAMIFPLFPNPWVNRVAEMLRQSLMSDSIMREHMPSLSQAHSAKMRDSLARVVERLHSLGRSLKPEDVLGAADDGIPSLPGSARLQRNPLTFLRIAPPLPPDGKRRLILSHVGLKPTKREIPVRDELVRACLYVAEAPGPFTLKDVEDAAVEVAPPLLHELMRALFSAGAVRRVD